MSRNITLKRPARPAAVPAMRLFGFEVAEGRDSREPIAPFSQKTTVEFCGNKVPGFIDVYYVADTPKNRDRIQAEYAAWYDGFATRKVHSIFEDENPQGEQPEAPEANDDQSEDADPDQTDLLESQADNTEADDSKARRVLAAKDAVTQRLKELGQSTNPRSKLVTLVAKLPNDEERAPFADFVELEKQL